MLNLVIGVVAGLAITFVLNVVKQKKASRSSADPASSEHSMWVTIRRLALAGFVGFILGGVTAGMLERIYGLDDIPFGSLTATLLIAGWVVVVWLLMERRNWP